ncbi:PREDICTED: spermatid-associated protein [Eurypyga helias]|nr:PREDICTED: spermatid-associated protein [Eurypyga helias]
MSDFDLTNRSTQCTEPEIDYIDPRMKLRDEILVFVDGKRVNEIYCQPPLASHRKLFNKKEQNEWSIWEENRVLWEENQALRIENRVLWDENKALQCLQSQSKPVEVIYTDDIQQSLQKENKPLSFFQKKHIGFPVRPDNKALQEVQEKNRILEDFQRENKRVPINWKDKETITVLEESKDASTDLQKDTDTITAVEEGNPGPTPQQEHEAKKNNTTPTQNKIKSAPSFQGEHEILQALQDLPKLLHIFLKMNPVLEEKQGYHVPSNVNKSFEEEYNILKKQMNDVKNTVSDITIQMERLEKELIAITSLMYEKEGQKLAIEHQLGEM